MEKPLTKDQIWGVPEDELPAEPPKDYFDYEKEEEIDQCDPPAAGPGDAVSG